MSGDDDQDDWVCRPPGNYSGEIRATTPRRRPNKLKFAES